MHSKQKTQKNKEKKSPVPTNLFGVFFPLQLGGIPRMDPGPLKPPLRTESFCSLALVFIFLYICDGSTVSSAFMILSSLNNEV